MKRMYGILKDLRSSEIMDLAKKYKEIPYGEWGSEIEVTRYRLVIVIKNHELHAWMVRNRIFDHP